MNWLKNLLSAFKAKTLIIAVSGFVLGNLALNSFLLAPSKTTVEDMKRNLEELKETYIELRGADMSEIVKYLKDEVDYFSQKEEKIFGNVLSDEQIPLLISRLEREAETAGLTVGTDIVRSEEEEEESQAPKSIAINLTFSGEIGQVLTFLKKLEDWDDIMLLRDFKIYSRNAPQNLLNGQVQFITLIEG